jgi:hypothetical protein
MVASCAHRALVACLFALFAVLVALPGDALADATKGAQAFSLTFDCGGHEFTVVTPAGQSAAGQVVSSTGVLVQTEATVTFKDPVTGNPVTLSFITGPGHGQARGLQDALIDCSGSAELPDVGVVTFTFVGFFAPRH